MAGGARAEDTLAARRIAFDRQGGLDCEHEANRCESAVGCATHVRLLHLRVNRYLARAAMPSRRTRISSSQTNPMAPIIPSIEFIMSCIMAWSPLHAGGRVARAANEALRP